MTNLIKAVIDNDIEEVKRLITDGVDVNIQDKWGDTALIWAADEGYTGIVKLLLGRPEIDVNAKDSYDYTALMRAAEDGNTEIVNLLNNFKNK